ncbi:MAG: hypothetical protein HY903_19390 [Deltaproteobacteria bacterium]|nr:hypothetical protein [Deltaproteobacteria bacterium]
MSKKIAIGKIADTSLLGASVEAEAVDSKHAELKDAMARAEVVAASPSADAAVLARGDGFEVVRLRELGGAEPGGRARSLSGGAPGLVGVFAGTDKTGVRLVRASDRSTLVDRFASALTAGGLAPGTASLIAGSGLAPDQAAKLCAELLSEKEPRLRSFGPTLLTVRLLQDVAAAGNSSSSAELLARFAAYESMLTLRPDGYLVRLGTGAALQKAGPIEAGGGSLAAGRFALGQLYINAGGVLYAADGALRPVGSPIAELGLEGGFGAVGRILDGVETALLVDTVGGLVKLVTDPAGSLASVAALPSAVRALFDNRAELWERFRALPAGDQQALVSRIATNLVLTGAGGAGLAGSVGRAGKAIGSVPLAITAVLQPDMSLALATVSVNVGAKVQALGAPAGALYVLHMAKASVPEASAAKAGAAGAGATSTSTSTSGTRLTSRIHDSPFARKLSGKLSDAAQRDVDGLLAQARAGNLNPGIGTRALGKGFFELRGRNCGRVIIKQTGEHSYDVVGKFEGHVRGDAANSSTIQKLVEGYGGNP